MPHKSSQDIHKLHIECFKALIEYIEYLLEHFPYLLPAELGNDLPQAIRLISAPKQQLIDTQQLSILNSLGKRIFAHIKINIQNIQTEIKLSPQHYNQNLEYPNPKIKELLKKITTDLGEPLTRTTSSINATKNCTNQELKQANELLKIMVAFNEQTNLGIMLPKNANDILQTLEKLQAPDILIKVLNRTHLFCQNYITTYISDTSQTLKDILKSDFSRAMHLQQNIVLLHLISQLTLNSELSVEVLSDLSHRVAIPKNKGYLLNLLLDSWYKFSQNIPFEKTPATFITYLKEQQKQFRYIIQTRRILKYDSAAAYYAKKARRLISTQPHFTLAELSIHLLPEFLHSHVLMNKEIIVQLGGGIFLGLDMYWSGILSMVLRIIISLMADDLTPLFTLFIALGQDEIFALNQVGFIKQILNFVVHLGVYSVVIDNSLKNLFWISFGYVFIQLLKVPLKWLTDTLCDQLLPEEKKPIANKIIKIVSDIVAYQTGEALWIHMTAHWFARSNPNLDKDLLENKNKCLENLNLCQSKALAKLGLDQNASPVQVKNTCRELKLKHPDRSNENGYESSEARIVCRALEWVKKGNAPEVQQQPTPTYS